MSSISLRRLERPNSSLPSDMSLSRVLRLGTRHFRSLAGALSTLIVIRATLFFFNYRTVAARISLREERREHDPAHPFVKAWSVKQAARIVPFATCLPQALTLQYLLARTGHASVVRIGVRVDEADKVDAHAWVVYDDKVLLGGTTHDLGRYSVLTDLLPASARHA